jgi:hypothetical protein
MNRILPITSARWNVLTSSTHITAAVTQFMVLETSGNVKLIWGPAKMTVSATEAP